MNGQNGSDEWAERIAYLRARWDEEEAFARRVSEVKPYFAPVGWAWWDNDFGGHMLCDDAQADTRIGMPDRLIADIASKRSIVSTCEMELLDRITSGADCARSVLDDLVQPYARRDDFDPAWRLP